MFKHFKTQTADSHSLKPAYIYIYISLASLIIGLLGIIGLNWNAQASDFPEVQEQTVEGNSATTHMALKADDTKLSFICPSVINFAMKANGEFITPTAGQAYIENLSLMPLCMKSYTVTSDPAAKGMISATGAADNNAYEVKVKTQLGNPTPFAVTQSALTTSEWSMTKAGGDTPKLDLIFSDGKMVNITDRWGSGAHLQDVVWNATADVNNQVTVQFDSTGGSPVADQVLTTGAKVTAPTPPTRDGFEFSGWFTDSACSQAFDFAGTSVNQYTLLFAKWNKLQEIHIDPSRIEGGTLTVEPTSAKEGDTVTVKGIPEKDTDVLKEVNVTGEDSGDKVDTTGITDNETTFIMPGENVDIEAKFGLPFPHYDTLGEYSWDELKTVANAISDETISAEELTHVQSMANAGETIKVNLSNEDAINFRILGLNHDDKADGSGKAGLTFQAVNSFNQGIYTGDKGDSTSTYAAGWATSPLRTRLQSGGDLYALFPNELTSNIAVVTKTSNVGYTSTSSTYDKANNTTSPDAFFLPSFTELGGTNSSYAVEGSVYEFVASDPYNGTAWEQAYRARYPSYTAAMFTSLSAHGFEFLNAHKGEYATINDVLIALNPEPGAWVSGAYYDEHTWQRSVYPNHYTDVMILNLIGYPCNFDYVEFSACLAPCFAI